MAADLASQPMLEIFYPAQLLLGEVPVMKLTSKSRNDSCLECCTGCCDIHCGISILSRQGLEQGSLKQYCLPCHGTLYLYIADNNTQISWCLYISIQV